MKRKIVFVLLACAMSFSLAACGSASSDGSSNSTETSSTDKDSTTASAESEPSDESKDNSVSIPSEVTPDTLKDFPASEIRWTAVDENGESSGENADGIKYGGGAYYTNNNGDKVLVIPSEDIIGEYTTKITTVGTGSTESDMPFCGCDMPDTEAIVIPESVSFIQKLWYTTPPEKLKYILLPTKFENTGLEDKWDPDHKLTWIYEDVEGKPYKRM